MIEIQYRVTSGHILKLLICDEAAKSRVISEIAIWMLNVMLSVVRGPS